MQLFGIGPKAAPEKVKQLSDYDPTQLADLVLGRPNFDGPVSSGVTFPKEENLFPDKISKSVEKSMKKGGKQL